jgi:hypothetical protein
VQVNDKRGKRMNVKGYHADFTADDAQALLGKQVGITEWADDESGDTNTYMGTVTMVMRSMLMITSMDADTVIFYGSITGVVM